MMAKNKKVSIIHCLDMGIFPVHVSLCVGYSHKEIMKFYKKVKAIDWEEALRPYEEEINKGNWLALKSNFTRKGEQETTMYYIVTPKPFDFSDDSMCSLAHEVLHICQFALPVFLDEKREYECFAYLHTHLMKSALNALRGKTK